MVRLWTSNMKRAAKPLKRPTESRDDAKSGVRSNESLPEVALAAVASYKRQKEVTEFLHFMLEALQRNSNWLNDIVGKQTHFRCALMTGAGPNRFQIQEIVYPSGDEDIRLQVELSDSDDHDKVALAAIMKLSNANIDGMMKYIKTRMFENPVLKEDLLKGKALGISFALLRPISDQQFRVMERIVIGSALRNNEVSKKRRKNEKSVLENQIWKYSRVSY